MQFSTKIDGFEQKESQGFENSYNSYEQYPLEKFFIFTIYQNYTLALTPTDNSLSLMSFFPFATICAFMIMIKHILKQQVRISTEILKTKTSTFLFFQ